MSKKGKGISEKLGLSKQLQAVVGKGPLSRPEVVKKVWAYIKKHDLQNEKHRQWVHIEGALDEIFVPTRKAIKGVKPAGCISMFDIASQLGKHLIKAGGKVKKNPVYEEEDEELEYDAEDEDEEEEEDEDYNDDEDEDEEDDY